MKKEKITIQRDVPVEIHRISRERIGPLPAPRVIVPKTKRPPKHRLRDLDE